MAGSLLKSFVSGTRQVLAIQLFVSIGAVALAGWTLAVTNELIRERARLRERVVQLEQTIASTGTVVPAAPSVVEKNEPAPDGTVYPGEVGVTETPPDPNAPPEVETVTRDEPEAATPTPTPPPETVTPTPPRDLGSLLGDLFAPPPPMRVIVLHVRARTDVAQAQPIADELMKNANMRVIIDVMPPRDPRESGYAYFDGRQSRDAAALVTQFHDIARMQQVAPWSAQLRGVALPAQGEYTADRLDIVLPPLPAPVRPNLDLQRVDPRILQRAPVQRQGPN